MSKTLNKWLDEFVENGANPENVIDWPEDAGGGTSVIANPELVGDEPELIGLEVEGAKYKIPEQEQADWNQSNTEAKDYIKNKPEIPASVLGTNDGTNWTSITIGNDTYDIPQGGKTYTHYIYVQNAAMNTKVCWRAVFSIPRSTNTKMTWADVCHYLEGVVDPEDTNAGSIPATGIYIDADFKSHLIYQVGKLNSKSYFKIFAFDASISGMYDESWTPYSFKDLVVEN